MALQQVARVGLPARLPSAFRCHVGMAPTSTPGSVPGSPPPPPGRFGGRGGRGATPAAGAGAGGPAPARFAPYSPASPSVAGELGNALGSRAGTPTGLTAIAGGRRAATESTRRARG